jgi:hypothetical protein
LPTGHDLDLAQVLAGATRQPADIPTEVDMTLRVAFIGGPAEGLERDYPSLDAPLPRLWWSETDQTQHGGVYERVGDTPDPVSGRWQYRFAGR